MCLEFLKDRSKYVRESDALSRGRQVLLKGLNAVHEICPLEMFPNNELETTHHVDDNIINAKDKALMLDKKAWIVERIVSLTARPETIEDAALVILLGKRTLRSNDSVIRAKRPLKDLAEGA